MFLGALFRLLMSQCFYSYPHDGFAYFRIWPWNHYQYPIWKLTVLCVIASELECVMLLPSLLPSSLYYVISYNKILPLHRTFEIANFHKHEYFNHWVGAKIADNKPRVIWPTHIFNYRYSISFLDAGICGEIWDQWSSSTVL